jgi:hypothetical protein
MDALTRTLMQTLSGGGLAQLGQILGADEQKTSSALSSAVPLLVSALATEAAEPRGAKSLYHALEKDHDGSVLADLSSYLTTNPDEVEGAGILKHALGGARPAVETGLAAKTGLDAKQIATMLEIAAPLVMGLVGQKRQSEGLDVSGLAALLGSQVQTTAKEDPDILGILNSALDADKDGSAIDEVMGFVGKLFDKK